MEHSQKAAGRFVVARGQAAELFEAAEKPLDFVSVAVQIPVNGAFDTTVFLAGNDDLCAQGFHAGDHAVRVVAFVGQYVSRAGRGRQQVGSPLAIRLLAGAEQQAQRIAQRVD